MDERIDWFRFLGAILVVMVVLVVLYGVDWLLVEADLKPNWGIVAMAWLAGLWYWRGTDG